MGGFPRSMTARLVAGGGNYSVALAWLVSDRQRTGVSFYVREASMMKKLLAVALLIIATPAQAETLSPRERHFVVHATVTVLVALQCGVKAVPGGGAAWGDRVGVDTDRLSAAFVAATNALGGRPYERNKLIPEVTRIVNEATAEFQQALQRDKADTCTVWTKHLRDNGLIE
jgi:hypothetical protein